MLNTTMREDVSVVVNSIPIGVSGALIFGVPLSDWIVVGTAIVLIYNLFTIAERIYRRVTNVNEKRKR